MKKINIEDLVLYKEYYIIFKDENLIIPLGILQHKIEWREFLSFHWYDGPTCGDIEGYSLYFSNIKDINLKKRLGRIKLSDLNNFFQEYDGFYLLSAK